jgi:glycosyltransferase involved in cell wall biosynthesis
LVVTSEWPTKRHPTAAPYMMQQIQYLKDAGVQIDVYPFHGSKNPFIYLKGWIDIRRLSNSSKYCLIHVHWGQNALITIPPKLPLVVTFHGSDIQGVSNSRGQQTLEGKLLIRISKYIAKQTSEVIIVSEHLHSNLPAGLNPHVIPSGVNLNMFKPISKDKARERLGLHQQKKIILFAANPNRSVKRFSLAQSAVNIVDRRYNAEILAMVNVPHHLVPLYMNAADVLLLTSRHEGSPTVVKEALACQLPIIATDVGDVKKRITHIDGCFICKDDQPETIAENIETSLSINQRLNKLENLEELDEAYMAKKIIKVYQRAIG